MIRSTTRGMIVAAAAMACSSSSACSSSPNNAGGGGQGASAGSHGNGGHETSGTSTAPGGSGSASGTGGTGGSGGAGGATGTGGGSAAKRDPHQQPFASASIWNMPIGSGAVYVDANLPAISGRESWVWAAPYSDSDYIVLQPDAPLVDVRESNAAWSGANRCDPTAPDVLATVPIPDDYVVPTGSFNNAAAVLAQDGRTFVQFEPLARCTQGGVATSLVRAADADLYGDGIKGGHGGSGMSSIGGTLRLTELRPGQKGPRHVLKFTANMKDFYKCATDADCFRWPAQWADTYAVGHYGTSDVNPNKNNAAMKMGVLLALPPDLDLDTLGLKTEPAQQIAWTLQNYGAYVDEDAFGPSFYIGSEISPKGSFQDQFKADYHFDFNVASDGGDWAADIQKIMVALKAIDNNDAAHIGGGGTPRQPLAPEIAP